MKISFKQYRAIDLMLIFLAAAEALIVTASNSWFPDEIYVLSPTVALVCIVMMRWDFFAAIHAVGGGLALCIASGARPEQYLIYCVGNCFALLALLWFKFCGKALIRSKIVFTVLYTVSAFLAVQVGRWLMGLILGGRAEDILSFLTTDSLSLLFAVVVVLLARKLDGVFEDQKSYLFRIQKEKLKEELNEGDTGYGEGPENF